MLQHGPCCPNQPRQYGNACIIINEMTKVSRWKSLWFWFEISPYQLKLESDSADRKIVWRYAIKSLNIYQLRIDCSISYQGVSQKMIIVTVFRQFGICDWYSNCSVAKVATKGTGGGEGGGVWAPVPWRLPMGFGELLLLRLFKGLGKQRDTVETLFFAGNSSQKRKRNDLFQGLFGMESSLCLTSALTWVK